ncbi:PLC-like phosphodiesterase [Lipomyces kononenkoae]|uniref:PLC-like phosphodiesterase n=1 Tax=Lipomyces kononenkoae TaxID=34357 RepID=A0ACC3SXC8_LIPKO
MTAADGTQKRVPQTVGHRGFSAKYAENTLSGLQAAIEGDADAIETDVHMSSDGVVVISHDPSTKRVFGNNGGLIKNRPYFGDLDKLRTLRPPHEKMPLLRDLLQLFVSHVKFEDKWLVIDVKADNDVNIIESIALTMKEIKDDFAFWNARIVLGIWMVKFLPYCEKYLPHTPIMHIGANIWYARKFVEVPTLVGFSMLLATLYSTDGYALIRESRAAGIAMYVWTVNPDESMRMCLALQVDAVLTDNPVRFAELRTEYLHRQADGTENEIEADLESAVENVLTFGTKTRLYAFRLLVWTMGPIIRIMYR